VLAVALFLGGGPVPGNPWPGSLVQLASLPLLVIAISTLSKGLPSARVRLGVLLLCAVVAVPLLQLVPLPPILWTALPGRSSIAAIYAEAGIATPWLPVSLDPAATWRTVLTLIPGVAVFLSALTLDRRARRRAVLILIAFGFFSVILGLSQVARAAPNAVGLFANRNHFAALLYCALPFTAAWAVGSAADRRPQLIASLALCLVVFVSLLVGIGVARSRAGLLISMVVVVGCLGLAGIIKGEGGARRARMIVSVAVVAGLLLVLQFALLRILPRLEEAIGDDARWQFATTSLRAALQYLPFGSGIGTFPEVYASHQLPGEIANYRVNHAHNDYLELWLEAGLLAPALIAAFLVWFAWVAFRMWNGSRDGRATTLDGAIAGAAAIVIGALMLHSVVDYPLRATTINVVFAFACALLLPAPESGESRKGSGRRRSSGRPHRRRERA
jgi:O-antigen ligase